MVGEHLKCGRTKVGVLEEKEPSTRAVGQSSCEAPGVAAPPGECVCNLTVFRQKEPPPEWLQPFSFPPYLSHSPLVVLAGNVSCGLGLIPPEHGLHARDCQGAGPGEGRKLHCLGPWLRELWLPKGVWGSLKPACPWSLHHSW